MPPNTAGALFPREVLGPALAELRALAAVAERQSAYHFFSASVLLLYEGAACGAPEARVSVRLIDFAHAFPAGVHCAGPDANFHAGILGLAAAIEAAMTEPKS